MDKPQTAVPVDDAAPHILIVDDDTRIRDLLTRYLKKNGFRASSAEDAATARRRMASLEFDVLVLDVMMPGEDGKSLARSLRDANADIPVIMLTARSEIEDRIAGLEAGADDYLTKPFDPRELVLRIQSMLRRRQPQIEEASGQIMFGPYTFSLSRLELKRDGTLIRLTEREREIMSHFANHPGETVARDSLAPDDAEIGERTIDVQINRLRRKIESDPANPVYLQTVRGIGYRLVLD